MFSLWTLEPSSVQGGGPAIAPAWKITSHVSMRQGVESCWGVVSLAGSELQGVLVCALGGDGQIRLVPVLKELVT